jgi:hypothetical protein
MKAKSRVARSRIQTSDDTLSAGLAKHASTFNSFIPAGKTVRTADVIALLQGRKNTGTAAASGKTAWQAALAADRSELARTDAVVSGIKQSLQLMCEGSVDVLADFGLSPRKPRAVSPAVKVIAAAKAKATRAARHTMGPKQKAAIRGSLEGVKLVVKADAPAAF